MRERRDPKFEVRGSMLRKPRTSDREPSLVSLSYPEGMFSASPRRTGHRRSALQKWFFRRLLVRGAGWFWAEPGGVLEDAPRAGVVDELLATDETLLHRHLAPGAEAIGEVG